MLFTSYLYQALVLIVVYYDTRLRQAFPGIAGRGVTRLFLVAAAVENMAATCCQGGSGYLFESDLAELTSTEQEIHDLLQESIQQQHSMTGRN